MSNVLKKDLEQIFVIEEAHCGAAHQPFILFECLCSPR